MKNAFTLIELICVITILGLIALIAIPTINNMIIQSKEAAYTEQIELIEDAARKYMSKENQNLPLISNTSKCITIDTLQKSGYLDKNDIENPCYSEEESTCTEVDLTIEPDKTFNGGVNVTWNGNKYTYKYTGSC